MSTNKIKVIGHRGAAGLAFENTIASMLKAIELGVDYIEIDVWKTADNEIVVFHDATLERLTFHGGLISNLYLNVPGNDKLNNGDRMPVLQDVIALVKQHNVKLFVEIKAEDVSEPAYQLLKASLGYDEFVVGSFYHHSIMELKLRDPQLQTAAIFEGVLVGLDGYLEKVDPDYVVISIETHNKYLADIVKQQNRKLFFYTINTPNEFQLALNSGAEGVITNYPNIIIEELKKQNIR